MDSRKKRYTRAELLLRALGLIGGTLVLAFLALGSSGAAWHMYERLQAATDAADASSRELALLSSQSAELKQDISDLNSPRGVEAALRERYGVIKPGEGVIELVSPASTTSGQATSTTPGIFARIFHTLFPW